MDDGVELKQLTVGVDSVGLGVGAGPLANAIVLMAISAASVVIVLIIIICFWLFGCDCWKAAVAVQEKVALGVGGLFLTSFYGNSGAKFSKQVRIAPPSRAA